ncbi:M23 family metallopeptidase [Curtobacterium caseinilyticum]|uniref:M23 family metallopeptidase n=1 Tax=Curtobacterium caseinilyticum TaxID=3055137 RepID=A0ABT7TP15_9MICO|nr:M23 family metallopeptidase [Curtobacterium caseinilyticum]MDM7891333.1 M23 family metallopeptidase [Curtobacterium caseinilyticum]
MSTPGSAVAVPLPEARAARDAQEFVVASGQVVPVTRDDFSVQDDFSGDPRTGAGLETVRPVAGTIPTAGGFGSRHVPGCAACSTDHHGLDFAAPYGQPVLAAMPGVVVQAAPLGGYGNQILLAHPDGSRSRYGHLSRIDVRVGQRVDAGQVIGAVGSTGVSTGPHLHFEVILGGTAVDPAPWLATRGLL